MNGWTAGTVIGRLQVRTSILDSQAAEARVAGQLRTARLTPTSVGERAILCVRHIRDPLPGTLRLGAMSGSSMPPSNWEQAVRDELDARVRRASRPVRDHHVPSAAEAVLFADPAELLACLASDVCAGSARERWWWRSLYRDTDLERVLLDGWHQTPQFLPPALDHLATRGQARSFVRRLAPHATEALLSHMVTAFGLSDVAQVLAPVDSRSGASAAWTAERSVTEAFSEPARSFNHTRQSRPPVALPDARVSTKPPWARWAPESLDSALAPRQQALLGIGLLLNRAPAMARTPAFVRALEEWSAVVNLPAAVPAQTGSRTHARTPLGLAALSGADTPAPAAPAARRRDTASGRSAGGMHESSDRRVRHDSADTLAWLSTPSPAAWPAFDADVAGPADLAPTDAGVDGSVFETQVLETRLGGIFYLINVGIALGLYADFTQPREPGLSLPIWDFLTLVARRLLPRRHPTDPVWQLLRTLGGRRRREPPGANWTPPSGSQSTTGWLQQLMPDLRNYLRKALAVSRPTSLGELVCLHAARVSLTPVYLDVHFALDELPISIRMAGLDRDPGWVPAAGRQVAFHFD